MGYSLVHFPYVKDSEDKEIATKTRDTNCHVEMWFWLVKQSILQKKKFLRPANFIHKLYGSLQGRYKEHIIKHNLPNSLLTDPLPTIVGMDQVEEQWAKRERNTNKAKRSSKYFKPPDVIPKAKHKPKKSNGHRKGSHKRSVTGCESFEAPGSATEKKERTEEDRCQEKPSAHEEKKVNNDEEENNTFKGQQHETEHVEQGDASAEAGPVDDVSKDTNILAEVMHSNW